MIFTKYIYRLVMVLSLLVLSIPTTVNAENHQPGLVLSFDDTFVDQWYDFFSQSDVNDVKATFFVSHWHTLSTEKKEKLRILQSNGHEIGHHGYSHKGVSRDFNYDPNRIEEYLNQEVIPALNNMQADGFNPVSFSYPYGEHNYNYDTAIKSYLPYLRTTFADTSKPLAEINEIYHSENKSYGFLAGDGLDNAYENEIDEIQNALIRAKNNNEIVTFYSHRIIPDDSPDASHRYGIRVSKLLNVINSARQLGLKFYTFQEAYEVSPLPPPPPPSSNNVITSVEDGNRVRINWDNQENDFIGIVPANQAEWQEGMPAVSTDGSSTGKIGITVSNPIPNQEYVAILYLNGAKVATSDPFVISVSTLPETSVQVAADNTVTVTWSNLIHDFIGIVPADQSEWQAGMPSIQTNSNSAGEVALIALNPIFNQNYVVMFYLNGTKVATSAPFTFTDTPPPSTYEVTTSVEAGNRVRISWTGLNNNFIGIVPTTQDEWQEGMAGSLSSDGSSGKIGITVPNPIPDQEYAAIFYLNGTKVGSSTPFIIARTPSYDSPTAGSTLNDSSQLFIWDYNGLAVDQWALFVGSSAGDYNYGVAGANDNASSALIYNLPTDGSLVHARLWYKVNSHWDKIDTSYTASLILHPAITSPISDNALSGSSHLFTWDYNSLTVEQWALYAGSSVGDYSYGVAGAYDNATSASLYNLPIDGSQVYVRLWYKVNGHWDKIDSIYTASHVLYPTITAPVPDSTLSSSSQLFTWDYNSLTVEQWALYAGSSVGDYSYGVAGAYDNATSTSLYNLPIDGSQVYLRLWYKINGHWGKVDASYTTSSNAPL